MKLTRDELEDIANGAIIYASGGGGSIVLAAPLIDEIVQAGGVELCRLEDLSDKDWVAVAAGAGSPDASEAKEAAKHLADASVWAYSTLGKEIGKKLVCAVPVETGLGNTLLPMVVGSRLGIPVVDGAGARRSLPTLPMTTFASHGVGIAPVLLANEADHRVAYKVTPVGRDGGAAEASQPMGAILSSGEFDNAAGVACWPMTGSSAKSATTPKAVTDAQALGLVLRNATAAGDDPIEAVREALGGYVLLRRGRLRYSESQTSGGLDHVRVVFEDLDSGGNVCCYAVNENLIAWSDRQSHPLAMGPDLICYLSCSGAVFTNADLDQIKGDEIAIIGAPAQDSLRVESIVAAFLKMLRCLGYAGPYVPIEELQQQRPPQPKAIWQLPWKRCAAPKAPPFMWRR